MKRTLLALASSLPLIVAVAGCQGGDGDETTAGGEETGITSVATSAPMSTSGDGSSSSGELGSSGDGSSGSSGDPMGVPCMSDADCSGDQTCEDGFCGFCPTCCGEAVLQMEIITPNVVLVLDKSGSMVANTWDGDGDPNTPAVTRWFSLYNVVEFIATNFNASMNLGVQLFPSEKAKTAYTAEACPVEGAPEVAVAPMNGASVLAALPAENAMAQIAGGTPTRSGMIAAIEHLQSKDDGLPKYAVLVTDGAANCSPDAASESERFEVYDEALLGVVSAAAAEGIKVFVVGVDIKDEVSPVKADGNPDGINTFAKLNELADAGGVAKDDPNERFYNAQSQVELQAALVAISQTLLSCEIKLDPVPKFPNYVEVSVDGIPYGNDQVSDCASEDGWMYSSPAKDTILLCGKACADFQQSGKLDAQYKCPVSG
ncbi:MAG TPA: VWA domain-containing protein [Nannocystaceae bacterium]|nr:VWA domain-containing protein [Nannocystaceae bacterium]